MDYPEHLRFPARRRYGRDWNVLRQALDSVYFLPTGGRVSGQSVARDWGLNGTENLVFYHHNMTQEQYQTKVTELIEGLATDLAPEVKNIEAGIATTQHNYGRYGGLISNLSNGNAKMAKIIAAALIKAGANTVGVKNGLNLMVLGEGPVGWTEV